MVEVEIFTLSDKIKMWKGNFEMSEALATSTLPPAKRTHYINGK